MKRICMFILVVLFLCVGCQPTPEQEYVINKRDNDLGQKVEARSDLKAQTFPSRWEQEATEVRQGLTVRVDADILQKADGLYPVYRTRGADITIDDAAAWAGKLLPAPVSRTDREWTKAQWEKELQDYLQRIDDLKAWIAAGRPYDGVDRDEYLPDPEEIEEQTNQYMELIQNAPDKNKTTPLSDFRDMPKGQGYAYALSDGSTAYISWDEDYVQIGKGCRRDAYIYYNYYYEDEKDMDDSPYAPLWQDVTMTRGAAEAVLQRELQRLGFEDFSIFGAFPANLMDAGGMGDSDRVAVGWSFHLKRNPGGYPTVDVPYEPAQELNYGATDEFTASPHMREETLELMVDERGVQCFLFSAKKEIAGIENTNVELLPFEEAKTRILNAFAMCYPTYDWNKDKDLRLEIYRVLITSYTLRLPNSEDRREVPCYVVFYDDSINYSDPSQPNYEQNRDRVRNDPNLMHDCLFINAVDGSVIHTDWGW